MPSAQTVWSIPSCRLRAWCPKPVLVVCGRVVNVILSPRLCAMSPLLPFSGFAHTLALACIRFPALHQAPAAAEAAAAFRSTNPSASGLPASTPSALSARGMSLGLANSAAARAAAGGSTGGQLDRPPPDWDRQISVSLALLCCPCPSPNKSCRNSCRGSPSERTGALHDSGQQHAECRNKWQKMHRPGCLPETTAHEAGRLDFSIVQSPALSPAPVWSN
jgi:hypothetical protein